jgi:hypothetical protein
MKRLLFLIAVFISTVSFTGYHDVRCPKVLPNVIYTDAFVWNAAYTPSGQTEIAIVIPLDDVTGNYTSRVTVNIYGYYRKTQLGFPQVYWQWEDRQFTVDIPPNSHDGFQSYVLHAGETFDMSGMGTTNGQGEWIHQVSLVSYVEL